MFKGRGEEVEGNFEVGLLKFIQKLDPMPNLRPISQTVWPEHSAFIFQYFGYFWGRKGDLPSLFRIWVKKN